MIEKNDTRIIAYTLVACPIAREDGDSEVLQVVSIINSVESFEAKNLGELHDKVEVDDKLAPLEVAKVKTRDVLIELLDESKQQVSSILVWLEISTIVEYK